MKEILLFRKANINTKFIAIFLLITLIFGLSGCNTSGPADQFAISSSNIYFDTVITVTLYEQDCDEIFQDIWDLCNHYEMLFSPTKKGSDLDKINHSNGTPCKVQSETIDLLSSAIRLSEQYGGIIDPSIGALKSVWKLDSDPGEWDLPSQADIMNALSHTDYRKIEIHPNESTITLPDSEMTLDLGYIAKGYIAEKIKQYLIDKNINHAIITLGGNVLCIGTKPSGKPYEVGVQYPFHSENAPIYSLKLKDQSLVTSGIYERYREKNGTIYSHILNLDTGYPVNNEILSVSILGEDSMLCDAYSTLFMLMPVDQGLEIINSIADMEAIYVTSAYEVILSDGLK